MGKCEGEIVKKTITKQQTHTIDCCDLCECEVSGGFYDHCCVCNRQVCFRCSQLMFLAKRPDDLLDLGSFYVCLECQRHDKHIHAIQTALSVANDVLAAELKEWKEAAQR